MYHVGEERSWLSKLSNALTVECNLIKNCLHLLAFYGDTINSLIYAGNSKDVMTTKISWLVSFCDWSALLINVISNPYLGFVIERVLLCYFVFHIIASHNRSAQRMDRLRIGRVLRYAAPRQTYIL